MQRVSHRSICQVNFLLANARYGAWHDQVGDRRALEHDPWIVVALVARFRGAISLKTESALLVKVW